MKTASLALAFSLFACVDNPDLADTTSELGSPTVLTFYESSNFTGRTYSVSLATLDTNERIKLINKADIEAATLLGKISSVRLACGANGARVVLFDAYNASNTSFASWSHLGGQGHTINCVAGATTSVNLHVSRPALADHVGSAFLVTHAAGADNFNFSEFLESAWDVALDQLPSEATATKTEIWLETTTKFRIRQYLKIDHWACTERGAVFEYRVALDPSSGTFSSIVTDSYVDYGTGDLWGCRSKMKSTLDTAVNNARPQLENGLEDLVQLFAPDDARYYFAPDIHLTAFDLFHGG